MPPMTVHHRTCNLCEATCGILVEVDDDRIVSIRGDDDDPFSRGYICPKAHALKDMYEDADRLRRPMVREGGDWRETTWDEAIDVAARGLHDVQRRRGLDAVAVYLGNPSVHNLPALFSAPTVTRALDTRTRFSASSVDQFPRMLAAYLVYGAQLSIPVADVDRTDYFLVLGANPLVSNGSLMTAPGMRRRLREVRERGGKVVVVDPRRTETARAADEHVFIRPGADALLLLAMISVLFEEERVSLGAAEGRLDGLDHVREIAARFTPERVAAATGVEAATIRRLAREFSEAPTAAAYARIGTCVQSYGTLASYLVDVLNIVAGRIDAVGGVMFTTPAAGYAPRGHYGRWKSRVRGIPEFGGELPVATMAEEIDTDGEGQVRAMFTMAGNPVLSTPNGRRLDEAMAGLDFMVSVDPCLNETTRHASVILPPRHSLENHQYSLVFHRLAVRNTAKFTSPVFAPDEDSWSEWEICSALVGKLAELRAADGGDGAEAAASAVSQFEMKPPELVGALLSMGPYEVTPESLLENPSGVDLGPLEQGGLDRAVQHDDGRIKLEHEEVDREIARLEAELAGAAEPRADGELLLIGRRQLRSNNSWMHNCPSLMKGRDRCTLLMHPDDAARLGLHADDAVNVRSRVGEVAVPLELTDDMMPGVVSLPHGFGHDRDGIRQSVASAHAGASMNDLTDENVVEGMMGNAVLTGVPVRVTAAA